MTHDHDDDRTIGRILARRQVLALLGTSAGAAIAAAYIPRFSSSWFGRRNLFAAATAGAAEPCIVRPEQTEGPYFVDELLNRSDIRSDPSDGTIKEGTPLTLAFAVQRLSGSSCVPLQGAVVDLWHCDAAGIYSDVQDPGFNTVGKKFLRGYQTTDAAGAATFITIYPGWYQGRTVHMHFKIRTDPDSTTGFEFTSQLYFDDALTDVVHAAQPYAAKGQRTLQNDGDGIYGNGGDELLLTLAEDGAGGYTGTVAIALALGDTPGGGCATIAACLTNLESTLPVPASATSRKARRIARRLHNLAAQVAGLVERAETGSADKQAKRYARARAKAQALLALAQAAAAQGTLGVELAPLESAIDSLLAQLPA